MDCLSMWIMEYIYMKLLSVFNKTGKMKEEENISTQCNRAVKAFSRGLSSVRQLVDCLRRGAGQEQGI